MSLFNLKPCPFCGCKEPVMNLTNDDQSIYAQALCPECHAETAKFSKQPCWEDSTVENFIRLAIESWNKRTPEENK